MDEEDFQRKFQRAKRAFTWLVNYVESQHAPEEEKEVPKKREKPEEKDENNKQEEEEEAFECAGQLWKDPPEGCVEKKNKNVKAQIKWEGGLKTVCKDCKNAKTNFMAKKRKLEKKNEGE